MSDDPKQPRPTFTERNRPATENAPLAEAYELLEGAHRAFLRACLKFHQPGVAPSVNQHEYDGAKAALATRLSALGVAVGSEEKELRFQSHRLPADIERDAKEAIAAGRGTFSGLPFDMLQAASWKGLVNASERFPTLAAAAAQLPDKPR